MWRSALNEAWFTTPHFAPGNSAFIVPTTSAHTTFTAVPKTHRHRRWVNPSGGYLLFIWAPGVRFFLTSTKGTPHVCLQNRLPAGTGHRSAGRPSLEYEPADSHCTTLPGLGFCGRKRSLSSLISHPSLTIEVNQSIARLDAAPSCHTPHCSSPSHRHEAVCLPSTQRHCQHPLRSPARSICCCTA